jgi:hypothetical protein
VVRVEHDQPGAGGQVVAVCVLGLDGDHHGAYVRADRRRGGGDRRVRPCSPN